MNQPKTLKDIQEEFQDKFGSFQFADNGNPELKYKWEASDIQSFFLSHFRTILEGLKVEEKKLTPLNDERFTEEEATEIREFQRGHNSCAQEINKRIDEVLA